VQGHLHLEGGEKRECDDTKESGGRTKARIAIGRSGKQKLRGTSLSKEGKKQERN